MHSSLVVNLHRNMGEKNAQMHLTPSEPMQLTLETVDVKLREVDAELNSNIEKLKGAYDELVEYKIVVQNSINTLPDDLLIEILFRLPCSKFATRCKSVCKRWACLVSLPYFVACFTLDKKRKHIELFCTSVRPRVRCEHRENVTWNGLTMYLRDPFFKLRELSFCSLPTPKDGNATAFTIHSSCNDLFVYCKDELGKQDYYICNIRTHQWLLLPTFPFYYGAFEFEVAFSCDPYCSSIDDKMVVTPAYRYSIIVLPNEYRKRTMMRAHLFSNTKNEWTELQLLVPQPCQLAGRSNGFVFGGKLHFISNQGLVGCDPYNYNKHGVLKCHIISWPNGIKLGEECTGVCQGKLRLTYHTDDKRLLVWCLKDYEKSEWSLHKSIENDEWIIRNERISNYIETQVTVSVIVGEIWSKVLAIHPTNPNVIYLVFPKWIALCKLSEKSVEIVASVDAKGADLFPCFRYFPSVLPSWPTPLPTLN